MNSKYFNLFYFILFILCHLDGLNQKTVSILFYFILFYFKSYRQIKLRNSEGVGVRVRSGVSNLFILSTRPPTR